MTVTELYDGRSEVVDTENPRVTIPYVITEAADEAAARTEFESTVATYRTFGSGRLKRTSYRLELIDEDGQYWRAEAYYEKSDIIDTEDPEQEWSGSTIGGTTKITQSLETRASVGDFRADHKGAIGFDGENVQGCDIVTSAFNFEVKDYKDDADMTPTYLGTLFSMSGTINDDDVRTPRGNFNAGELLYLGATYHQRQDDIWELIHKFSALPNKTGVVIGDLDPIDKRGWDYLWVEHAKDVDENAGGGAKKVEVKIPIAAYVERVYEETDFLDLELEGWS